MLKLTLDASAMTKLFSTEEALAELRTCVATEFAKKHADKIFPHAYLEGLRTNALNQVQDMAAKEFFDITKPDGWNTKRLLKPEIAEEFRKHITSEMNQLERTKIAEYREEFHKNLTEKLIPELDRYIDFKIEQVKKDFINKAVAERLQKIIDRVSDEEDSDGNG